MDESLVALVLILTVFWWSPRSLLTFTGRGRRGGPVALNVVFIVVAVLSHGFEIPSRII